MKVIRVREGVSEGVCERMSIKGSKRLGGRRMTGWTVEEGAMIRKKGR
jgi:hypothetical protein